jgi:hypothetical protein
VLAHQPDLSVLDVTKYCIAAGHGTSKLVASNAYGWYCTSPSAPVDTTAACNLVYHVNDAVSPVRRLRPAPTPSWV